MTIFAAMRFAIAACIDVHTGFFSSADRAAVVVVVIHPLAIFWREPQLSGRFVIIRRPN